MAKAGRPTTYTDKMPMLMLEALRAGKSVVQFCAVQDICRDTFYEWLKVHPIFSDTYKRAKMKYEAHWEEWLIDNLANPKINAPLVKMLFANRHGWSDKKEVTQDINLVAQEVQEVIDARKSYEAKFKKDV